LHFFPKFGADPLLTPGLLQRPTNDMLMTIQSTFYYPNALRVIKGTQVSIGSFLRFHYKSMTDINTENESALYKVIHHTTHDQL
jgi:hypothetical protein